MSWPKTPDGQWYIFEGQVLMPVDPSTGVAQLLLRPQGGMALGIPAVASGEKGDPATLSGDINVTELAHDDPSPADGTFELLSPGPPPVYRMNLSVHRGAPGEDGTAAIDVDSVSGTPSYTKIPQVNAAADGFEYASQLAGEVYWPSTIANTAPTTSNSTLAVVSIPTRDYPRKLMPFGYTIIGRTGANVVVDLVARLDTETSGNVIGYCHGVASSSAISERLMLAPVPAPGAAANFNQVPAGEAAVVFMRTEKTSGSDSYTTSGSTSRFGVLAVPLL